MKKRRSSLFQRMLAVLLTAVLTAGMVSNAVPVSVLAAGGSITQDGYTWNIPDTMNITVGEEENYGIYGGGSSFYNINYSFTSSDSAVAAVDGGGRDYSGFDVTGVSEGTATIIFTCSYKVTYDGETKSVSGSFDVVVTPAKYTLTVNNGTGGGGYEAGAAVTITADAPEDGKQFDKWVVNSGSVTLADAASSTTTFTMPAEAVEVTAAYKDSVSDADRVAAAKTVVENALAKINPTNGTEKEEVEAVIDDALREANVTGMVVVITTWNTRKATASQEGKIEVWVKVRLETSDPFSPTDYQMVKRELVIPKLQDTPPEKYTVTVNNGTGGGGYEAGAAVTITADAPASGKQFDKWVVNSGSVALADAASSTTTFTMPAEAVTVTAAYKDSVSDADKVAAAKTVVENALNGFTAANATTQEEILNMINTALGNANITGVTVTIDKFRKNEATTSAAGQIDGVIFITCGQEAKSVNMEKPIAQLIEGGGSGGDSSNDGNTSNDNGGSDGNTSNDNGGSDGNTGNDNGGNIGSNDSGNLNGQSGGSGTATPGKAPAAVMIITPPEELENVVLTEAEKQQKAGGADIRIELDVDVVTAEADAADRALVEEALQNSAAGYTVGQYLDISLYKVIGDSRTAITETAGEITVRIDVPDNLKNTDISRTRTFAVIRVHDGRTELLSDLDNDADTITIATDRFSTYVLVHQDMETGAENQTVRKDEEPKTGDTAPLELYATFAMIAGFTYLLLYFTDRRRGMTEETKKELVSRLVGWAKRGRRLRKWIALAAVFVLLVYYHSIGKKTCAEWKQIYGE